MTIERALIALTSKVTDMIIKIDEKMAAIETRLVVLEAGVAHDFIVSSRRTGADFTTVGDLCAAINKRREAGDVSRYSVLIDSCSDALPCTITAANVHFVFKKSYVFNLSVGERAFSVTAPDVTLDGATFYYKSADNKNSPVAADSPEHRVEIRASRLKNGKFAPEDNNINLVLDSLQI